MKPLVAADEMFPEGIDIEDVSVRLRNRREIELFTFLKLVPSEWALGNNAGLGCK